MYRFSNFGFPKQVYKVLVKDFKDVKQLQSQQLDEDQIEEQLFRHQLQTDWKNNSTNLCRTYQFSDFKQCFSFMNTVSIVADSIEQYPKWSQKSNTVSVQLNSKQGLTIKDIILAFSMNKIWKNMQQKPVDSLQDTKWLSEQELLQEWSSNYQN